jgi:3-isopropylmalate dehydratase small subunit
MTPFITLRSVAAPLPEADVDTDIIYPARFLVITRKTGLGCCAFHERRFDAAGHERPDFVLHRPPWRGAQILVAGANFGCGSSREQAPWALADLGLRCIVAPGFGEIFETNCINNGLLPVTLPAAAHSRVLAAAQAGEVVDVELQRCELRLADGTALAFTLGERQRQALLNGWDEIDRIRHEEGEPIAAFEKRQRATQPWLYEPAQTAGR